MNPRSQREGRYPSPMRNRNATFGPPGSRPGTAGDVLDGGGGMGILSTKVVVTPRAGASGKLLKDYSASLPHIGGHRGQDDGWPEKAYHPSASLHMPSWSRGPRPEPDQGLEEMPSYAHPRTPTVGRRRGAKRGGKREHDDTLLTPRAGRRGSVVGGRGKGLEGGFSAPKTRLDVPGEKGGGFDLADLTLSIIPRKGATLASRLPGVVRILLKGDVPVEHFMGHLEHNPAQLENALRFMCVATQFNVRLARWQEAALRGMVEMIEIPEPLRIQRLVEEHAELVQGVADDGHGKDGERGEGGPAQASRRGKQGPKSLGADLQRHWDSLEECAEAALARSTTDRSRRSQHSQRRTLAEGILSCGHAGLGAKDARALEAQVAPVVKKLLGCEHCVLFSYDAEEEVLFTPAGDPLPKLRCPAAVAVSDGAVINVRLRKDLIFAGPCQHRDKQLGIMRSRSVLAVPVQPPGAEEPTGVLQAVNKLQRRTADDAYFSYADEALLIEMATLTASAAGNAAAFSALYARRDRERRAAHATGALVQVSPTLFCALEPERLFEAMGSHAQAMLRANLALMFLLTKSDGSSPRELWTVLAHGGEYRLPLAAAGPAGHAVTTRAPVNCVDVRADPRFAHAAAAAPAGFPLRAVLCSPVMEHGTGRVLGVVQAVNKIGAPGHFTAADADLLAGLCALAAPVARNCLLMRAAEEAASSESLSKLAMGR